MSILGNLRESLFRSFDKLREQRGDRVPEIEQAWTKGPTAPFLDCAYYEVEYRYRANEWDEWTHKTIGMTARNESQCRRRVQFLVKKHRWTVDVLKVTKIREEAEISTGKPTKVVSDKEYREISEKTADLLDEHEEEIASGLRAKGIWLP